MEEKKTTKTQTRKSKPKNHIYPQNKIMTLIYTGEKQREFKESLQRPFPILNKGDIVLVDIKTGRFMARETSPFEIIDPNTVLVG
jgi:hypothetical protein